MKNLFRNVGALGGLLIGLSACSGGATAGSPSLPAQQQPGPQSSPPGGPAASPGATTAPGATSSPGTTASPGATSSPGATASPGATSSPGGATAPQSSQRYIQLERLARPLTKELWERFVDHQQSVPVEPYADPVLAQSIQSYTDIFRAPAYGTALTSLLIPDETAADLSDTTDKASFLGLETGGYTGGRFGGRDLADDVVSTSFSMLHGDTLNKTGLVAQDDGRENNCLRSQNLVQRASQANTGSFPFLAPPH